ncbi:glycosyltransferase family 2 protein [Cetobacterium sp. SF1]|uniref:glycosyltransferase family 2 protein n=1 Tax=Cetobacterium sp. SF1 TaxID=3417654 RepID=UPI003CE97C53
MGDLISIITPMYNSEKYILETYLSIKNQTYNNWEWIVINDCSKDNSYKIVKELEMYDSRIKILDNKFNLLAAKSRNKGLRIATGKYITFLDSDDLWKKNFLEMQLKLLKEKKCSVVFSSYKRISEDLKINYGNYIVPEVITYEDLLKTNYMSCLTVMFEKNKFKTIFFNENLKMHEDYIFWLELLEVEKKAYANKEVLALYRIRNGSVSRNKFKNLYYMYIALKKLKKFSQFKIYGILYHYIYYGLKKNKEILLKK